MEVKLKYRGRAVSDADVAFVRELIARHSTSSRRALSILLCEAWSWRQPNGELSEMLCRSFMLALHRAGLVVLPPARLSAVNNVIVRRAPPPAAVDRTALEGSLGELQPLEFRQVRRSADEKLFDSLIEEHHYLGYVRPVGAHLKYMVYGGWRPLACLAWCSAPYQLGPRDRFIGWSAEARQRNLRFLAYNTRFLILPWVRVPHLASHILGRMARLLSAEWERVYAHPLYYLETFTDPTRFRGTCYRAANWVVLGRTTGRGQKDAPTKRATVPLKEILGYPLTPRFREILSR
jgi:hypothetical protein